MSQPIQAGADRVKVAAWLLLLEAALAAITLWFDSIESRQSLPSTPADLSTSPAPGPLFLLPILVLMVLAAMAVGVRPRGGRWLTLPAQLVAALVLLVSLRGVLEVMAAVLMALVGTGAELLLFKPPPRGEAG